MIDPDDLDPDDLDPEAVALALGGQIVDDDPWWAEQEREAHAEYIRAMAALERRKRRERIAHDLAVVKAAQKAGLTVTRAPIDGVDLEFGPPPPAPPPPEVEVTTPEQLRRLI
jgi:hypothetical protein